MDVLTWIKQRFPVDCNWTTGNCYFFAKMLEAAFPGGTIMYDPIVGHFLYKYQNCLYDYHGIQPVPTVLYRWEQYKYDDPKHWLHIMRDCVGGAWSVPLEEKEA